MTEPTILIPRYDPVTELMVAQPCDGVAALLLAPEKQALKITDNPVWITGVGYSQDTYYLGDRNLSTSKSMESAGKMAFGAAQFNEFENVFGWFFWSYKIDRDSHLEWDFRRLIEQGAVKINEGKSTDVNLDVEISNETLLQVGKRKFLKVKGK